MVEVRWTHQAYQDLQAIVEFIAKDSSQYARLFVIDIFQAVDRIAEFPKSGRMVPELDNPTVRELILGNYRLVYRLKAKCAELLTIYHGARLLDPDKLK
jgi:plasmid stabilization system protein ParE